MVLHIQLRQLSMLQSFDNKMDDLYKDGLPEDPSAGRVGPKQKVFIRKRRTMVRKLDGTLLRQYERMRQSRHFLRPIICWLLVSRPRQPDGARGRVLCLCSPWLVPERRGAVWCPPVWTGTLDGAVGRPEVLLERTIASFGKVS